MIFFKRLFILFTTALLLGAGLYAVTAVAQPVAATTYMLRTADGLSLALSADGQVAGLEIDGRELVSARAPTLFLRDLSNAGDVITPNLLLNPGFEAGLSGWTSVFSQGLQGGVVFSPTHSGGHALAFTNTTTAEGAGGYASDAITVTPGQRYRLSAWFLSSTGCVTYPTGTPPLLQMNIWQKVQVGNGLYVTWLDKNETPLGPPQLVAPLHAEASRWRLIRGEITAPRRAHYARADIVARLSRQTLWVDDAAFVASPEPDRPLSGQVTPCPGQENCLQQTIRSNDLIITVIYTAHADHIAVHGEIVDESGRERALDIHWAVPFDPVMGAGAMEEQGGPLRLWWDDVHTSRRITQPLLYANEISAIYDGWLPMSLYPYAGVQISSKGVALGLPLDRPQLALLAYDGASGRYGALYHLGISPQAVKVGPRATFDLMLYRFDPARGFRDVIARHQTMQPDAYHTPRAQDLYNYQGRSQGQYGTPWGVHIVQEEDKRNIYSAQYIASDLVLKVKSSEQSRPDMTDIMHVLSFTLNSPFTETAALGQAITHSAAVEPNGEWSLKQVGVFPWDVEHWQAAWAGNLDPDIELGLAPFLMDFRISRAFSATTQVGAHLDGVQIDNFMTTPTFDLRPQALAGADWPLSYTPHTYQPAVHTGFAQAEFLAYLRHYLDATWGADRGITVNFWGMGHPNYLARYIDGFGSEGELNPWGEGLNWNPAILDYRRALAARRPYLFAIQSSGVTATQAYTAGQLALLYGVYPGHGPNGQGWDPAADRIISDTAHLVGRYWVAGWEPLTYARADYDDVWIERFGRTPTPSRPGEDKGLFFTIHNRSDITRTTTITLESAALEIHHPNAVTLTDIAITQTLPFLVVNGNIRFDLTLGPRQTRIVQVDGGAPQHSPVTLYLPVMLRRRQSSAATFLIDADPAHGPGPLSPLWRPGIVWQGGGPSGSSINPRLVDFWAGQGGFDRIGLVRIVPELDSISRHAYHLHDYADLVQQVRDHGGRLLVKIRTTPKEYTNTPDPPPECPPNDPDDWRYEHRYAKYGVVEDKRVAYGRMIQDFIRYFSASGETVTNQELFGDDLAHPTLGMPNVLYELWDEPNYDMLWCDTEEHFLDLYQLIVQAADQLRASDPHLQPFTIGGPGWREQTKRNDDLPPGFGAPDPDCLPADNPDCGAIRRFYDGLKARGYLENGHVSWWSYSYLPTELTRGASHAHLDNIRTILHDERYEGRYDDTKVVVGEWGPPFGNAKVDLLPATTWEGERGVFFGLDINDDNEVGASLIPARIWDMTRARPQPDDQSYFQIGEWPLNDYLPLFKGTAGLMTSQALGLRKAAANVFLMLNRLESQELSATYRANPRLNLVATASEDGSKLAALLWHHPSIKPYEEQGVVAYDDLWARLAQDGVGPVQVDLAFEHLTPNAAYTQTLLVMDAAHSNAFTYRHAILDDLRDHCGDDPREWRRACVYQRIDAINAWTLAHDRASVDLESTRTVLTADAQGRARVPLTLQPYSVWLVTLQAAE